jgi:hypothetical protein
MHHVIHRATIDATDSPTLPTSLLVEAWEVAAGTGTNGVELQNWTGLILSTVLTQGTPGARPTFRSDLNSSGFPGLEFDGTNDHLSTSDATVCGIFNEAVTRPELTIYAVMNGGGTASRWSLAAGNSVNANPIIGIQSGGAASDTMYVRDDAGTLRNPSATISSGTRVLTLQLNASGSQFVWDNRTNRVNGGTAAGTGGYTFDRFAVGGLLRSTFSNPSAQAFHAVYLADAAHDATQRTTVWDYLTSKWGTP